MPIILLSNDDGIDAEGLQALIPGLGELGELWVVAPDSERSAAGRAVSLNRPLRVHERAPRRFAVNGTPTDCVLLATRHFLPARPDLVVSGINGGYNIGEDLDYSGTVAVAAEGALQGARASMAVSRKAGSGPDVLKHAVEVALHLARLLLVDALPKGSYMNVNVPVEPSWRLRFTRQGNPLPPGKIERRVDPRGQPYYWIANRPTEENPPPDTDRGALREACISVGLLTMDRSHPGPWRKPSLDWTPLILTPAKGLDA